MPRTPMLDRPEPVVTPRPGLVSSAATIIGNTSNLWRRTEPWQEQCWYYRNTLGEVRYASEWFANALSRAVMLPARYDDEGTLIPIKSGDEVDQLRSILGGLGGSAGSMKSVGEHLFVAGECYLLGRAPVTEDEKISEEDTVWEVVASDTVKKRGTKWTIDYGDGDKYDVKDSDDLFRIHKPHPTSKHAADSALRAVLPSLREIELLSLHVLAQVRSRLAGAGILFISNETSFAAPTNGGEGTDAVQDGLDPFMKAIADVASIAIADPSNPTAMIPIIARVPSAEVNNQNLVTFWSELDAKTMEMRSDAIRRTALGIDLPPEVLLGTADVNHWGAWQIEESTIKAHIEPALEVIAAALTRILRKVLDDPTVLVVFDTSALRLRPNRSKEAVELYDRNEINGEALRRETGFSEADEPDDDEREQWYLRKIASGSASPEQVEAALRMLGIDFPETDSGGQMRESRPDPSITDHPEVGPPPMSQRENDAQRAALEATCDAVVHRALERAGNRLRSTTTARPDGVETMEMHLYVKPRPGAFDTLLEGAWSTLPRLLRNQPFSHACIEKALDSYVRALFASQQQHDPDAMMRFVDAGLEAAA